MRPFGDHVRTWRKDGFVLELYDTHVPTGTGRLAHTFLAYRFSDRGTVLFQGDRYTPPLSVSIDSEECIAALLRWFVLRPGDVEVDYFNGYTPLQREFIGSERADDLAAILREMEAKG